ncbi:MAG: succinate dehydrogenase, cytochrome b556 subunit [Chloroflexi bacterium]|nr:succinate dehydrogenase, cytochrome b556 subunit [Chloroflexota bacterium]
MSSMEETVVAKGRVATAAGTGIWAWVLQRVTAVLIALFLGIHFWVLHFAVVGQSISFERVAERLKNPWFIVVDLGLLAAVLYHALNGVRAIVFDFGIGRRTQRILTVAMLATGTIVFVVAAYALIAFIRS